MMLMANKKAALSSALALVVAGLSSPGHAMEFKVSGQVNRAITVSREDQHTCQTSRSGRTRRQQICACCSQPRVRGHVLVCTHVNKVCAKCRATAGK